MPRVDPDSLSRDEEVWDEWSEKLGHAIYCFERSGFVTVVANDDSNVFVQFARVAARHGDVLVGEASVGNHPAAEDWLNSLQHLGWHLPGSHGVELASHALQCLWEVGPVRSKWIWEFPGWHCTYTTPLALRYQEWISASDARDAAGLATSTLRLVMGVTNPFELAMNADSF